MSTANPYHAMSNIYLQPVGRHDHVNDLYDVFESDGLFK